MISLWYHVDISILLCYLLHYAACICRLRIITIMWNFFSEKRRAAACVHTPLQLCRPFLHVNLYSTRVDLIMHLLHIVGSIMQDWMIYNTIYISPPQCLKILKIALPLGYLSVTYMKIFQFMLHWGNILFNLCALTSSCIKMRYLSNIIVQCLIILGAVILTSIIWIIIHIIYEKLGIFEYNTLYFQ